MRPLVTYINKVAVVCDTTAKVVSGGGNLVGLNLDIDNSIATVFQAHA